MFFVVVCFLEIKIHNCSLWTKRDQRKNTQQRKEREAKYREMEMEG